MRRGKLTKSSYIILLASAIFTILAYVSDQVVINKQNKSRIDVFGLIVMILKLDALNMVSISPNQLQIF